MKKNITIIIALLSAMLAHGQQVDSTRSVKVLGRARENSIMLRWATTDPSSWKIANKYGYTVERYTIIRDREILPVPEKVILNRLPIKPHPQADWLKIFDTNDYAAIAAQAIYGESFEASPGNPNNMLDIVNKAKEIEQRYSFALFAADHSFETALLSGLGLKDSTVKVNEKYLYKIFVNVSPAIIKIDTGSFFIGLKDRANLPKPQDVFGTFGDRVVHLKWPVNFLNRTYVSYIIERSDNEGKTFNSIHKHPFLNTDSDVEDPKYFIKTDSLPENNQIYYYRVRGQTAFGETGPPSDVVSGSGVSRIRCEIGIISGVEIPGHKVQLDWKTACDGQIEVQGFELSRGTDADGPYTRLTIQNLSPSTQSFIDGKPLVTNYYKVTLIGKNDQRINSHPYLVQLADSIPPSVPTGIHALIDTMGIVKISWSENNEPDLLGYRVFRSNFENSEYSQITKSPIEKSQYIDTVNLKTLTKKIFYKITAEDIRNNRSVFSIGVTIQRPDIIPPVSPLIKTILSTETGVEISGIPSSSEDVTMYTLYRKQKNGTTWEIIKTFNKTDSLFYKDNNLNPKIEYNYTFTATDGEGLQSEKGQVAIGKKLNTGIKPAIKKIQYNVNRESKIITLKWVYDEKDIAKYCIYRSANDSPISLYKTISSNNNTLADINIAIGTKYRYRVKAVFKDGGESPFSEEIVTEF